jgi:hypothetical protein
VAQTTQKRHFYRQDAKFAKKGKTEEKDLEYFLEVQSFVVLGVLGVLAVERGFVGSSRLKSVPRKEK